MGGEVNNQKIYARVAHAMRRHGGILSRPPWGPQTFLPRTHSHSARSPSTGPSCPPKIGLKSEK
jgi:hypothetical protein